MRKVISLMMVLGVLFLVSCGSGGSGEGGGSAIVGASLTLSSSLSIDEAVSKQGEISIFADVTDDQGLAAADGTPVYFSASAGSVTSQASTISGRATATYRATIYGGSVVINAGTENSADGGIQGLVDEYGLTVASGPAVQIALVSVTPTQLGLRGSGENEVGTFVFSVTDGVGGPVQDGQVVSFRLDAPTGGAEFVSDSSVSTVGGQVSVSLVSGTVAGVATVTASTVSDVGTIATEARITMGSSQPDQLHLGLAAGRLNIPGLIYNNLEDTITATVGDRYSNPVPAGTPVYFAGECGVVALTDIDGVATNTTNQFGQATATTITGDPRDELCRYIYWTEGQEAYIDSNGNGMYDLGEPHTDQGEPFIDADDDGLYDNDETYFDLDGNGRYTDVDNVWQGDTFVWRSMNVRWSANVAAPQIFANDFRLFYGDPLEVEFSATDTNGNPLPSGTTIAVSSDCPGVGNFETITLPDAVNNQTDFSVVMSLSEEPAAGDYGPCSLTVDVTGTADDGNGDDTASVFGDVVEKIAQYSGEDDYNTPLFNIGAARNVEFRMYYYGSDNYKVVLKASDGTEIEELVNGTAGQLEERYLPAGDYYLSIETAGAWAVDVLGF